MRTKKQDYRGHTEDWMLQYGRVAKIAVAEGNEVDARVWAKNAASYARRLRRMDADRARRQEARRQATAIIGGPEADWTLCQTCDDKHRG